jgi:hypothetical protein
VAGSGFQTDLFDALLYGWPCDGCACAGAGARLERE